MTFQNREYCKGWTVTPAARALGTPRAGRGHVDARRISKTMEARGAVEVISLPPHQPRDDRKNRAQDQHGRDREKEFESRPVNSDVAGQMKQMHLSEPRPS